MKVIEDKDCRTRHLMIQIAEELADERCATDSTCGGGAWALLVEPGRGAVLGQTQCTTESLRVAMIRVDGIPDSRNLTSAKIASDQCGLPGAWGAADP